MELSFRRTHGSCAYLPSAMKLWQGNVFTSICQEFCPHGEGGICLSACWDTGMLGYTLGIYTPPRQVHPLSRYTPWAGEQVHPQRNTPLGRYIPCSTPPGQVRPPEQVHHPWVGHPRAGTPTHPPWAGTPPGRSLQRTVRILLECFLVTRKFKQPDQQISKFEPIHIHPCPYKQIDFFAHCIIVPMTT